MQGFNKFKKSIAIALSLSFILTIVVLAPSSKNNHVQAAWYSDNAWQYRQKIVIDHTKVSTSNQSDFPVMVKITNQYNTVFTNAKDDGTDILFAASDGSAKLSHEIDTFSKTSKELIAWVKIPTLSNTEDTTIYMYYGNSGASDQQNKTDVWSNGYTTTQHLNDATTSTVTDSAGSNNGAKTAANEPVETVGKIGKGQSFDGSNDSISIPSIAVTGTQSSIQYWAKISNLSLGVRRIVEHSWSNGSFTTHFEANGNIAGKYMTSGGDTAATLNAGVVAQNTWHNITMTYTGTTESIYLDGSLVQSSDTGKALGNKTQALLLGSSSGLNFPGSLDEVRLSTVARSAGWIATEYNNQNDPSSFMSVNYELNQSNYAQVSEKTWVSGDWGNRQKITIDHTKVANTNQFNFPVLVKITDAANTLWSKAQSDGDDILFSASDGSTIIPHEIESYDPVNHELLAWVRIPVLSTSTDTTIYVYYGNASASSQQNAAAVWSNGYAGVWHMKEASGTVYDSLGVKNSSAQSLTYSQTGKIGKAVAGSYTLGSALSFAGDYTYEVWFNAPAFGNTYAIIGGSSGNYNFFASKLRAYLSSADKIITTTSATPNVWQKWTVTRSGTALKIYLNGRDDGASGTFNGALSFNTIGMAGVTPYMDEGQASTVARSADWIATEYNNQNSPDTFISFKAEEYFDVTAPANPSTFTAKNSSGGGVTLDAKNYYNYPAPYIAWPAAGSAGGASDSEAEVDGYYSYFGTSCGDSGADPALTRGLLSDTGSGLHYSSSTNITPSSLTESGTYCLRLKTKDGAGNTSATVEAFVYKFDLVKPTQPTYIAANPAGYSSTNSFAFNWPATSDTGGSSLAGYQYKRGEGSGDSWSETITQASVSGILSYQTGENIFYVHSIDNAGNVSDETQTNFYYASNAPTKPTDLAVDPAISSSNAFSFSWTAPVHDIAIEEYGYSVNAAPTAQNIIWTGSASTSLHESSYATVQGINTLYLIAKDTAGNYAFDQANYATVTFDCQTAAPPIPTAVSAVDSSDRAINRWMITTQWAAGAGQNSSTFSHYSIERSTDGSEYSELATTTSTAYIDADLSNNLTYYYRIKAVDNAGSPSAASTTVSKTPTGNYPTPPVIVTDPTSEVKASSATVTWVTNRISTGAVKFGTSLDKLDRSQLDAEEKTQHQITLPGLEPSTIYYFKVQSLDSARDYSADDAYSSVFTLKTLSAPGIQNVKITNISLDSADISWETSSASTTLIRYGTSINYDKSWEESSSYTTNHTFKLKDLTHTTTYHFKISGLDSDENSINSDDYVFDTLPMPRISAVSFDTDYSEAEPQTSISWTTNVPSTSSVEYFPKSGGNVSYEESQSDLITAHKVKLTKLSDDTSYSFYVSGTDQFGNKAVSDEYIFNTPFDSRAAVISNVQVEASNVGLDKQDKAQLIVSWKTDEPTTTQVEYGEGVSGDYTNKTSEDKTLTNEHFVIISDLEPNKPYHLRAISKDKGGNESIGEDVNTIPGEVPRSLLKVLFSTFENIFGWVTKMID